MFGPHLMLELYGCDSKAIASKELIFNVLDDLPTQIGMHKISAPQILPYAGKPDSFDKGGISAFVLIAESHITVHTFKDQKYVTIDIFSCKEFNSDKAVEYLTKVFKPNKVEKQLIWRGREFPHDIVKSTVIVRKERGKYN